VEYQTLRRSKRPREILFKCEFKKIQRHENLKSKGNQLLKRERRTNTVVNAVDYIL
jgi:hypothetical protein